MSRWGRLWMSEEDDPGPVPGMSELRRVQPPASLVPRVMQEVNEPQAPTLWDWLRRPVRLQLRLSPLGFMGLTVASAIALALALSPRPHPVAASRLQLAASQASSDRPVMVRFIIEAKGARHVAVAGSFNDWNTSQNRLEEVNEAGLFVATVPLPAGTHEYMFVVDGEWVTDPHAEEIRPDGFGRQNALLRL